MPGFFTSLIAFIVAIGVLVTIHEFGHFWVARRLNIKVLRFSIGFGKVLWRRHSRHPDATEYCISAIPLGGYVKMLDERDCEVAEEDRSRAFNRRPVSHRVAVLVAGPLFNFAFAVLAYWMMFVVGVPGVRPIIGEITPDSYADRAGLQAEDEILSVGGTSTRTWEAAVLAMLDDMLDDGVIRLSVRSERMAQRDVQLQVAGQEASLTEPGALFEGLGFRAWNPRLPAVLGELTTGEAAERGGLRSGDHIIEADGQAVDGWRAWVEFIRARPGQSVSLLIERDARRLSLELAIGEVADGEQTIGRIGASPFVPEGFGERLRAEQRYGPLAAISQSVARTWNMTALTLRMLWRMILGDVSLRNISGPINIAQYAGYTASIGLAPFLNFLAIVSISLGILNFLPIPLLDGGQIVYTLAEGVKGSPVSERAQLYGQQVGIVLLLVIMSFAFYNDLARLLG